MSERPSSTAEREPVSGRRGRPAMPRHARSHRTVIAILLLACALGGPERARAQAAPAKIDPSWLTLNMKKKIATFQLIAGLGGQNGALDFNGFEKGGLVLTVPRGWKVVLAFRNNDSSVAHSAEVIVAGDTLPDGPVTPAIRDAYTARLPQGIPPQGTDSVRFEPDRAGSFAIMSAVPGQAKQGMWIRLIIAAKRKGAVPTLTTGS